MSAQQSELDLPLLYETPALWAEQVLREPMALLNDHAHLEKKAATNALELLTRWPEPNPPEHWVKSMTTIARDEVEHLAVVTRAIARRNGRLAKYHRNDYAGSLHKLVRRGEGPLDLMDRLMVSALIEARSCERFELLSRNCPDQELQELYASLWASENGHYRIFIDLARTMNPTEAVEARWAQMLQDESRIIEEQPPGPTMHSGLQ